ncbi:cytochrome P450 [Kitasatospora sp. A2-31]|uniref:cytochrome P450 n=1 Tax=Kitasatospora sp. A2-31 TaxID=2916414 RepID=UPI001EEB4165|nr:cytochrome P450 [Kitasatospora sp. A2-31]MCG6495737.1 cytochrome P450 [Kitasatospora sp. A2-31]
MSTTESAPDAARCPVDHSARRPPVTIRAADLPAPKAPGALQTYLFTKYQTDWLEKVRDKLGHRFKLQLRPGPDMYVISDPGDIKEMFLAPPDVLHTSNGNDVNHKFFGRTGLAFLEEDEHKARRKELMPSFKGTAFQRIRAAIDEMAERDIPNWPQNKVMSLRPVIHRFTVEVIREVVFGKVTPSCWSELFEEIMGVVDLNKYMTAAIPLEQMSGFSNWLIKSIPGTGLAPFLKHRARADELLFEAFAERREIGELGDDLLSTMLSMEVDGRKLTDVELRDEIMTLFLAGTETTVSSLAWALEYLSRFPVELARLREEIDAGETDAYLEAVCYEVLRIRPPLPLIMPREVMKPIQIGGVYYEPGDIVWASSHLVSTDPHNFQEPKAFRPERYLDVKLDTSAWIPFGGGITRCLGDKIAIDEMKSVLRVILSHFDLDRPDMTPERVHHRGITTMPEYGARMALRARKGKALTA